MAVNVHAHSKGVPLVQSPAPEDKIFTAAAEYLRHRGIAESYWELAGLRVATQNENDLLIPFWWPDGTPKDFFRTRLLFDQKKRKFSQPPKSGLHLYWARIPMRKGVVQWPKVLDSPKQTVYVVEGEVKAMALSQHGIPAIGIGGVYNWGKDHKLIEEWNLLPMDGRKLIVAYDADACTKLQVQDALIEFTSLLQERGADVWILSLEQIDDDPSAGVDDYIAALGIEAFLEYAEKNVLPADDPAFANWGTVGRLRQMNYRHAVVMAGSQSVVLTEREDKILLSRPADLMALYANQKVGNKNLLRWWLEHPDRRTYQDIVFAPDGQAPDGTFNLWRGFAVEPKRGKCDLFLRHVRENIAKGDKDIYDYVVAWMADAVQNPAARPGIALALRGLPGTGKGIFAGEFGRLYHEPHFVHLQSARQLTGQFNAHMMQAMIVFADEALWAGDRSAAGPLKALVTEKQLPIELKGKDILFVRNHVRLILASNETWIVPAGFWERRFCVLDVGDAQMQDASYFRAIVEQMKAGGREALLHKLQNYNLNGIDLRDFPITDALWEQKLHSMSEVARFWHGRLCVGTLLNRHKTWEGVVGKSDLHHAFQACTSHKEHAAQTIFGQEIKRLVPAVRSSRTWDKTTKKQRRMYVFPSLDQCRRCFEDTIGQEIDWEE